MFCTMYFNPYSISQFPFQSVITENPGVVDSFKIREALRLTAEDLADQEIQNGHAENDDRLDYISKAYKIIASWDSSTMMRKWNR